MNTRTLSETPNSEVALDSLLNEGIISEIPIVKSIVSLGKLGISIKQIHLSKKILCFLKEFHLTTISEKSLRLKEKIVADEKYRNKITEHLIVILDRLRSEQRSVIFAKLFIGHIQEEYDWDTFVYFSDCLDSMQTIDFNVLGYLNSKSSEVIEDISVPYIDPYMLLASIERLKFYGFIGY